MFNGEMIRPEIANTDRQQLLGVTFDRRGYVIQYSLDVDGRSTDWTPRVAIAEWMSHCCVACLRTDFFFPKNPIVFLLK